MNGTALNKDGSGVWSYCQAVGTPQSGYTVSNTIMQMMAPYMQTG